jgi:hypothetical protein
MLLCGLFPYKVMDWVHDLFHKKEPKHEIKRYSYADEVSDSDLTTIRVRRGVSVKRQQHSPVQN